jgi:hypothetical protein
METKIVDTALVRPTTFPLRSAKVLISGFTIRL